MTPQELDELLRHAREHGEEVVFTPPNGFELVKREPALDTRMGCVERAIEPRRAGA